MSNSDTTTIPIPINDLPQHPFIVPDDPEGTRYAIDGALAVVELHVIGEIEGISTPAGDGAHLSGLLDILTAIREAVKCLGYMAEAKR